MTIALTAKAVTTVIAPTVNHARSRRMTAEAEEVEAEAGAEEAGGTRVEARVETAAGGTRVETAAGEKEAEIEEIGIEIEIEEVGIEFEIEIRIGEIVIVRVPVTMISTGRRGAERGAGRGQANQEQLLNLKKRSQAFLDTSRPQYQCQMQREWWNRSLASNKPNFFLCLFVLFVLFLFVTKRWFWMLVATAGGEE